MREEYQNWKELLLGHSYQEEEGDEDEGGVQRGMEAHGQSKKKMTCPHCNKEIDVEDPEKYFIKLECPNCGGKIEFDE